MGEHFPVPRSHPGRPTKRWSRPLPVLNNARDEVAWFASHNSDFTPLLKVFDQLAAACGTQLFGSAIMGGGFVVSARPDVVFDEGVLLVRFDHRNALFSLEYRNRDVEPTHSEQSPQESVWERLRLLIGYKFGIRLPNTPVNP